MAKQTMMTRSDIAVACGKPKAYTEWAGKKIDEWKVKPAHKMRYGRGMMELYDRAEVQQHIDVYNATRIPAQTIPSEPKVVQGSEAKLIALEARIAKMHEEMLQAVKVLDEKFTAQNKALLVAVSHVDDKAGKVASELGVKLV